jgi:flagellar biosynthesis activator protein FlaF
MQYAHNAYSKVAIEIASPRDLETNLLLTGAAKLHGVLATWRGRSSELDDALLFNRRLWTIFIDAVIREDNKLAREVRANVLRLGMLVLSNIVSAMTKPRPEDLESIIKINRGIAAGLRGKI